MTWKDAIARTSTRPKVEPDQVAVCRRIYAHQGQGLAIYFGEQIARKLRFTKDNLMMVRWGLDDDVGKVKIELTDNKRAGIRFRRSKMFPIYSLQVPRIPEVYDTSELPHTLCHHEVFQNMVEGGRNLSYLLLHLPRAVVKVDAYPPRRSATR